MKPIPISAAEKIAKTYDYDQVVVVARKVGDDGGEHVTTYGVDTAHCEVAARIGTTLKHHLMRWPSELFQTGLRVFGVGRDPNDEKSVTLDLSRPVSDDDIRVIHEFLKPSS
ncbi:hypothetical protein [Roseibium album]|uniref:hypothetical protein n=1 Tax=Roseibium album TaxID=311410 RepID=UPI002492E9CD|nr:hypothetical protein [Roseibium album]